MNNTIHCIIFVSVFCTAVSFRINIVLNSQASVYDQKLSDQFQRGVENQNLEFNAEMPTVNITFLPIDYTKITGYWTVFPLINLLDDSIEWTIFLPPDTTLSIRNLYKFLQSHDPDKAAYFGRGLLDRRPTIIHHFGGFDDDDTKPLVFPSFQSGIVFSRGLVRKLKEKIEQYNPFDQFSIDPKYEFTRYILDRLKLNLIDEPEIFCSRETKAESCATRIDTKNSKNENVSINDVFIGVKTCSKYHRKRVKQIKRVWAHDLPHLYFYSDELNENIPTIDLGVQNTERGHCEKTFAILKKYVNESTEKDAPKWLVIADDDTLLSVPRLLKLLEKYGTNGEIIIGERYGYGFTLDGKSGYDYPTGGAGMVFTYAAAKKLTETCGCPFSDSPDDMVVGMCARSENIPILHHPGFHQAQPDDYASGYISDVDPISFHKIENINVQQIFNKYLKDEIVGETVEHPDPSTDEEDYYDRIEL